VIITIWHYYRAKKNGERYLWFF
jgi:hypothetical protein